MPETDQTVPSVEILEVSPRDGLQNESWPVSTADKVRLIEALIAAGVRRMEATSFVHPGKVPQMADAEDVMAAVPRPDGISYIGLVLNQRGAVRAAAAGVHELNYLVPCTDTFGQRNQGVTTRQALDALEPIAATARDAGLKVTVTLAVAFAAPTRARCPSTASLRCPGRSSRPGSTSWRSRTRSAAASPGR